MDSEGLRSLFADDILWKAQAILDRRGVLKSGLTVAGERLYGVVQDGGHTFRSIVDRPRDGDRDIRGECSCRAKGPCPHLCALLLDFFERENPSAPPAAGTEPGKPLAGEQRALVYQLSGDAGVYRLLPKVALQSGHDRMDRLIDYHLQPGSRPPRFLQPLDMALLALPPTLDHRLDGARSPFMEPLLDSGRCFLEASDKPLRRGQPKMLSFNRYTDPQGRQHLQPTTGPGDELIPFGDPWSPPWYLNREQSLCGPTQSSLTHPLLQRLLELSPVPPEQVEDLRAELVQLAGGADVPLPEVYPVVEIDRVIPVPVLRIDQPGKDQIRCHLRFDYDGLLLSEPEGPYRFQDGRLFRIHRQGETEQSLLHRLPATSVPSYQWLFSRNGVVG